MTQLTISSNFCLKICFKFCILEQIIAAVLFTCISSINNKRSLLRFQSTTAPTNRGWSACGNNPSPILSLIPDWVFSTKESIACVFPARPKACSQAKESTSWLSQQLQTQHLEVLTHFHVFLFYHYVQRT